MNNVGHRGGGNTLHIITKIAETWGKRGRGLHEKAETNGGNMGDRVTGNTDDEK